MVQTGAEAERNSFETIQASQFNRYLQHNTVTYPSARDGAYESGENCFRFSHVMTRKLAFGQKNTMRQIA